MTAISRKAQVDSHAYVISGKKLRNFTLTVFFTGITIGSQVLGLSAMVHNASYTAIALSTLLSLLAILISIASYHRMRFAR